MDDWQIAPAEPIFMYPKINNPTPRIQEYLQSGYQLRNNPSVSLNEPINWSENPNNDRNWQFKINAWDMLVPFLSDYQSEQNNNSLDIAESVMLDWIHSNLVENKPNAFKWHDMATGLRAVQLGFLLHERLSQSQERSESLLKLIYAADLHAHILRQQSLLSEGNHGLFQIVGLASLCKAVEGLPSCDNYRPFVKDNFSGLMAMQFSDEGVHLEHSSQYHPWAIQVLDNIRELKLLDPQHFEILDLAKRNTKWYFQPDGQLNLIGDSDRKPVSQYRQLHPELAFLHNNRVGREPVEQYKIFHKSGLAFYRSHWRRDMRDSASYLAVAAGFHSRTHKQQDDLSFEWFEKGIPILTDSGKYSYDINDMTRFVRSRFAHNTVTVGDENHRFFHLRPYGSAIEAGGKIGDVFWLYMELNRTDVDARHYRLLALLPRKWLVIADNLIASKQQTYRQWFHFSPEVYFKQSDEMLWLERNDEHFLSIYSLSGHADVEFFRGQETPKIQGWISEQYRKVMPRVSMAFKQEAKEQNFVTLFTFDKGPLFAEPAIFNMSGSSRLCWRDQSGYQGVVFDRENKSIEHCDE